MSRAINKRSPFTHMLNSGNSTFEFKTLNVHEHPFDCSDTDTSTAGPATTTASNGAAVATHASDFIHGSVAGDVRCAEVEEDEEEAAAQPPGPFASGVTSETVAVTYSSRSPFAQSGNSDAAAVLHRPTLVQPFGTLGPAISSANNISHGSVLTGHNTSTQEASTVNNVVSHWLSLLLLSGCAVWP